MHQETKIGDDAKKKPEIIKFYYWSKAGVDTMDKTLGRYTIKRSTRRWPLASFYNILDVACLAAYILYYENNKVLSKKSYERLFYRKLSRELCTPFVEDRSHNAQIMRHFTTRVAIESFFGRAINPLCSQQHLDLQHPRRSSIQRRGKKLLVYAMLVSRANSKIVAKLGNHALYVNYLFAINIIFQPRHVRSL